LRKSGEHPASLVCDRAGWRDLIKINGHRINPVAFFFAGELPMLKLLKSLLLLCLTGALLACAQTPSAQAAPSSEFATEGLHAVQSSGFSAAYVRPDAGLPSYKVLDIEKMSVADVRVTHTTAPGTNRRDWLISPVRETNLQQAWERAMNRSFAAYSRSGSGDKVLRITAGLTQLAPGRTSAAAGRVSGVAGNSMNTVDVSAEFRLYEQSSGDLLAVIRDTRTIVMQQWTLADGANMANLFSAWSALLHTRISGK
jgi:hypothetical protein